MDVTQRSSASRTPWDTVTSDVDVFRAPARQPNPDDFAAKPSGGGGFTIPLICLGLGLIACCVLIPAADENRQLAYERARLQADLEQLQQQVAANDAFLKRVGDDATLAERLARRQMKMVPEGTAVLDLKATQASADMSPFLLVTIPPPAALEPYQPIGGFLASACRNPRTQLYVIGGALLLIAAGLVLSRSSPVAAPTASAA